MATAFYYNSRSLLLIRTGVEKGDLKFFLKNRREADKAEKEEILIAKPLPYDQQDYSRGRLPTSDAVVRPYPDYFGTSRVTVAVFLVLGFFILS